MSAQYVYALTGSAVPSFAIEDGRVESIDLGGIFAITEPLSHAPAVSEKALRRQHVVVSTIAERTDAVLPARFGSFVEIEELRLMVNVRREVIRNALDLVRGREQMTVRIMGATQPAAALSADEPVSGTDYLNARRARASGSALPGVEAVQRAVKDLAAADRVEPKPEFVSVYHLIAAGTGDTYRARINEIAPELLPLVLRVSGPWPPFAFVPELIA